MSSLLAQQSGTIHSLTHLYTPLSYIYRVYVNLFYLPIHNAISVWLFSLYFTFRSLFHFFGNFRPLAIPSHPPDISSA
jgi:hypothetical protein